MKELNKIFYDILLKLDLKKSDNKKFETNSDIIKTYFSYLKNDEKSKIAYLKDYFSNFYNYCFNLTFDKMIEESINFKN